MKRLHFQVGDEDDAQRLDKVIAARGGVSRGRARRLLEQGAVFVDGRRIKVASRAVRAGQRIEAVLEEAGRTGEAPAPLAAGRVLHRDDALVAVDKPAGVPAQPTRRSDRGALPELAAAALDVPELFLVHRLDLETSGVTVLGRTAAAARALMASFREGAVHKTYLAVTSGVPSPEAGTIDAALEPDPAVPGRHRVAAPGGVPARTSYRTLERLAEVDGRGHALVELVPTTGRTHQLRAHLAHLGTPILGDRRYGAPTFLTFPDGRRLEVPRCLLHAAALTVPHPATGAPIRLEAPIPADLARVREELAPRPSDR